VQADDVLLLSGVTATLRRSGTLEIVNETRGRIIAARHQLSDRQLELLIAGSLISYLKACAA
jgi:hypothetical protein